MAHPTSSKAVNPPSLVRIWLASFRLHSLSASVVPVLVGTALVYRMASLQWGILLASLIGAIALQIATNLTDEYADHQQSQSKGKHLTPHKVIAHGWLSVQQVRWGACVFFGVAFLLGLWVLWQNNLGLLPLFVAGALVAWAYSAGPFPLGDYALGEVLVFGAMGPGMVLGVVYAHTQLWSEQAWWFSLPVGALVSAILVVNNLRDRHNDIAQGRITLVTLLGIMGGRVLYALLLLGGFAFVLVAWGLGWGGAWLLLPLLTLPLALVATKQVMQHKQANALQQALRNTAKLHGLYGLFLALGLVLDAYFNTW